MRKQYTPSTAASDVEDVIRLLEGRWKLVIRFHLFDGKVQRYSDLEKLIPGISQKMLAQQLRQLEADGIVARKVYPQVPPKVEYSLTKWGQSLPRAGCLTPVDGAESQPLNPPNLVIRPSEV